MKKTLLFSAIAITTASFGQMQIGNSDMELWEAVSGSQEPVNWNSFLTAQGGFSGFAANQIEASSIVRPGSTGTKSARIWSRNAGFGVTANGNLTLGKINMGSATPANSANYNFSMTSDPNFSEALTDTPDSLVFWARFTPIDTVMSMARVKATLHDNYDYRDPEDATSSTHVVAIAELNYSKTSGAWKRFSVPFDYTGPATGNTHILITFTTNMTPGGGDPNDEVLIDDIQLIYNVNTISENVEEDVVVYLNNTTNELFFDQKLHNELYAIYNALGQKIQSGKVDGSVTFEHNSGVYFVHVETKEGTRAVQVFKK